MQRRSKLYPAGLMLVVMPVVLPQLSQNRNEVLQSEELSLALRRHQPVLLRKLALDVLQPVSEPGEAVGPAKQMESGPCGAIR